MRMRIADNEIEHYAKAKRDGAKVRVQGRDWRVLGVTVDMMGGAATKALSDVGAGRKPQWWVELAETG
jgi:hypothetical protein